MAKHYRLTILFALHAAAFAQMAPVPGGTFEMGSNAGRPNEQPAHRVTISPFSIDAKEVTFGEYRECVRHGACTPAHYDDGNCLIFSPPGFKRITVPGKYRADNLPVVCVTWRQADRYCRWKGKRLPTEAQWEYAALAGTGNAFSWGNEPPSPARCTPAEHRRPRPAGSHPPNGWGLFDMTGNVWEWVEDHYQEDFYRESPEKDPVAWPVGQYRVIRGGGWYSGARQLRIRNRQWFSPDYSEASIGFRCAK